MVAYIIGNMVPHLLLWINFFIRENWGTVYLEENIRKQGQEPPTRHNSHDINLSVPSGFEARPVWWEVDALTATPSSPPPPLPCSQAVSKKLNLCFVLMMTGVDKCSVSRLINGVDTIKIEDPGNARTPKYYKVLLSLIFFSKF